MLRQEKGRGIVVIDREIYAEKFIHMLSTKKFCILDKDPTKTIETKVKRAVKKMKGHLSTYEYRTLSSSGSAPGKFYGTAQKYKIP